MATLQQFTDHFIAHLAQAGLASDDLYNQYAPPDPNNVIRCENLRRYLIAMHTYRPKYLLVMEAPGYRGCRLTGIPVTSRKIMLEGVPELDLFGEAQGYQPTDDPDFVHIYGEQSATIVWETLADLDVAPLIWNTVPFHPHKAGLPCSNRRPRVSETRIGIDYLHEIITFFQPEVIIAVGNVAESTMMSAGINCVKVRHPAQGGKADFVAGLNKLISE
ncbi:MAG: uracil-DNA glycosylase [Anaerolineae bacterium]